MSKRRSAMAVTRRTATLAAAGVAAMHGVGARSAPAHTDPPLIGQWRFDEGGGQLAVDDGPRKLSGALGAGDAVDFADPERIAGASGQALRFDGDAFVRLPASDALAVQSLTAEAVVRADASPGAWRYLISRGGHGCIAGSYGLYTAAAGGLALYVYDGARYVVSATARPADVWDGAWHHVAGTFDGLKLRLFVDGRPVGEPKPAPLHIWYAGASTRASFGQYVGDCELSFSGDMDLVRLWSVARSGEAIGDAAGDTVSAPPGAGPLPAAAPGTTLAGPGATTPAPVSGPKACLVRLVRKDARGSRGTVARVRVARGRHPLRATRLIARGAGRSRVLDSARTDASGRARLTIRTRRSAHVRISAPRHPACTPAGLRVRGS